LIPSMFCAEMRLVVVANLVRAVQVYQVARSLGVDPSTLRRLLMKG
jgi:hypothetical protein